MRGKDIAWKVAAIRLAKAIVRFQNDNFARVHTDSTYLFALKTIRQGKKR